MTPKKEKLTPVMIRVEPSMLEAIDALAIQHRISRGWIIREALRAAITEGRPDTFELPKLRLAANG